MDGSNLEIPDFKGPTPENVQRAIAREKTEEQILHNQQRALTKDVSARELSYKSAKRLLGPVNEARLVHQRRVKQITSEFEVK